MTLTAPHPSAAPTRKVTATAAAGAGATILAWIAQQFGLQAPPGVEAAFAVLLACAAGYLTRERVR